MERLIGSKRQCLKGSVFLLWYADIKEIRNTASIKFQINIISVVSNRFEAVPFLRA